jgi:hypothetical protein
MLVTLHEGVINLIVYSQLVWKQLWNVKIETILKFNDIFDIILNNNMETVDTYVAVGDRLYIILIMFYDVHVTEVYVNFIENNTDIHVTLKYFIHTHTTYH